MWSIDIKRLNGFTAGMKTLQKLDKFELRTATRKLTRIEKEKLKLEKKRDEVKRSLLMTSFKYV